MTTAIDIDSGKLDALRGFFGGQLLHSGDDAYHEARKVHNAMIDRRPALTARCAGAADVAQAVRFARDTGLAISVKGGGHNVAGRAVADDALMIDLSSMNGVYVDPGARTARAQGGALWRDVNR